MQEIVFNDSNLTDNDIEQSVTRVKALLINSKGKILIVYNNYTYQLPGGHLKDSEDIDQCIIREVREETGIDLDIKEDPFLRIKTYDDNYFDTGKKTLSTIYYYRFIVDDLPDINKTQFDELELSTEFKLFYVMFSNLRSFLEKAYEEKKIDKSILKEMLKVLDVYDNLYNTNEQKI